MWKMLKNKFIWSVTAFTAMLQLLLLNYEANHYILTIYTFSTYPYSFELPNWSAVILMPTFVYICLCLIQTRFKQNARKRAKTATFTLIGFLLSFNYGATISGSVYLGYADYVGILIIAIAFIAFLVKAYRAECILGFALSLCIVFGALSGIVYSVITAAMCYALYKLRLFTLQCHQQNSEHIRNPLS